MSVLEFSDLGLGEKLLDYSQAWELQRSVHAEVADGSRPDTVLLLEHPSTYTAGKRTEPADRPTDGSPVIDVDRGGKLTYHGPGQLVAYPIVALPEPVGVVDFVRRLEEAMIRMFADFGLATGRVEGRSGVWLPADERAPERKIAAIGIRVSRNVTMHGLAVNVDPDMSWFDKIVPCGLRDVGVAALVTELGRPVTVAEVAARLRPRLVELLAFEPYERSPDIERATRPAGSVSYGITVAV